jgi:hypothetical protein
MDFDFQQRLSYSRHNLLRSKLHGSLDLMVMDELTGGNCNISEKTRQIVCKKCVKNLQEFTADFFDF